MPTTRLILARRRWPHAAIVGRGRFAVVAYCYNGGRGVQVSLFASEREARRFLADVDRRGCLAGKRCGGHHLLADLCDEQGVQSLQEGETYERDD